MSHTPEHRPGSSRRQFLTKIAMYAPPVLLAGYVLTDATMAAAETTGETPGQSYHAADHAGAIVSETPAADHAPPFGG